MWLYIWRTKHSHSYRFLQPATEVEPVPGQDIHRQVPHPHHPILYPLRHQKTDFFSRYSIHAQSVEHNAIEHKAEPFMIPCLSIPQTGWSTPRPQHDPPAQWSEFQRPRNSRPFTQLANNQPERLRWCWEEEAYGACTQTWHPAGVVPGVPFQVLHRPRNNSFKITSN